MMKQKMKQMEEMTVVMNNPREFSRMPDLNLLITMEPA